MGNGGDAGNGGKASDFEAQLAALRATFKARIGDRLAELVAARTALAAAPAAGRPAALGDVARLAHGISGSAATFGYPEFSRLAAVLEAACGEDAAVEPALDELIAVMAAG